ncbi:hypothetical protein SRRS_36200 [Sporomusa rhizae]
MILKTVYGPPPADMERIEAAEPEAESESTLVREGALPAEAVPASAVKKNKRNPDKEGECS